jgi:hypothetical protein
MVKSSRLGFFFVDSLDANIMQYNHNYGKSKYVTFYAENNKKKKIYHQHLNSYLHVVFIPLFTFTFL